MLVINFSKRNLKNQIKKIKDKKINDQNISQEVFDQWNNLINFLNLSGNNIGNDGVKDICSFLNNHTNIINIDLCGKKRKRKRKIIK